MIRLIVNADDLGAGEETDRGILEAFRTGIVRSASLLPNGPSFASACQSALSTGLPLGVHLNLSDWYPLSGPIAGLTEPTGSFPGKKKLRRVLSEGDFDSEALCREMTAQVERVLSAGVRPDHIDTHQHFFLFASVSGFVVDLARTFGIRALRLPMPADGFRDCALPLMQELSFYCRRAPEAARVLHEGGFVAPQGLFGMPFLNTLDETELLRLLEGLPHGTWELMVHPGYPDPSNPFSSPQRVRELRALTSPRICRAARDLGIDLITFGDLSCALSS